MKTSVISVYSISSRPNAESSKITLPANIRVIKDNQQHRSPKRGSRHGRLQIRAAEERPSLARQLVGPRIPDCKNIKPGAGLWLWPCNCVTGKHGTTRRGYSASRQDPLGPSDGEGLDEGHGDLASPGGMATPGGWGTGGSRGQSEHVDTGASDGNERVTCDASNSAVLAAGQPSNASSDSSRIVWSHAGNATPTNTVATPSTTSTGAVAKEQRQAVQAVAKEQSPAVRAAIAMLKFYKGMISPLIPWSCRYIPTCSEYSMQAYAKYGILKGTALTACRLLRCNPFGGYGYDPPRWIGEPPPPEL